MKLFRQEVHDAKKNTNMGLVILSQPTYIHFLVAVVIGTAVFASILITSSEYSRRETVLGYLAPKKDTTKVFSSRDGVVSGLHIAEGQEILRGQQLITIKNSESLVSGKELSVQLKKTITEEIEILKYRHDSLVNLKNSQEKGLANSLINLKKSLITAVNSTETTAKKLHLSELRLKKAIKLYQSGHISARELDDHRVEHLNNQSELNQSKQIESNLELNISDIKSKQTTLPLEHNISISNLSQKTLALKSRLLQIDNQFEFVEKAPTSGIVTTVTTSEGQRVTRDTPLLSIIPKDSPLVLNMFVPSRSAGFINIGDKINIRLDAFPYQKFGFLEGQIVHIDQTILLPTEVELPIPINQAVYRVKASLSSNKFASMGKTFPLKIGMSAEADIILESRTILEWLLEPIYLIEGKM